MSVSEKINRLRQFCERNQALKNVPFMSVKGAAVTPVQAIQYLQSGKWTAEVMESLAVMGFDPDPGQDVYQLAETYYRQLAAQRPGSKIVSLGGAPAITYDEAAREIAAHTPLGEQLVNSYVQFLGEFRKRI